MLSSRSAKTTLLAGTTAWSFSRHDENEMFFFLSLVFGTDNGL
jgi:hypothetical protein